MYYLGKTENNYVTTLTGWITFRLLRLEHNRMLICSVETHTMASVQWTTKNYDKIRKGHFYPVRENTSCHHIIRTINSIFMALLLEKVSIPQPNLSYTGHVLTNWVLAAFVLTNMTYQPVLPYYQVGPFSSIGNENQKSVAKWGELCTSGELVYKKNRLYNDSYLKYGFICWMASQNVLLAFKLYLLKVGSHWN